MNAKLLNTIAANSLSPSDVKTFNPILIMIIQEVISYLIQKCGQQFTTTPNWVQRQYLWLVVKRITAQQVKTSKLQVGLNKIQVPSNSESFAESIYDGMLFTAQTTPRATLLEWVSDDQD